MGWLNRYFAGKGTPLQKVEFPNLYAPYCRRMQAFLQARMGRVYSSPSQSVARGCGGFFQPGQIEQRVCSACAAHLGRRLQLRADSRTFWLAKKQTPEVVAQLNTGHTRGFAARHSRNGRGDGGGNAAGSAEGATFHQTPRPPALASHPPARSDVGRWVK